MLLIILATLIVHVSGGVYSNGAYSVNMTFDSTSARFDLRYKNMPDDFWTGIGFGSSMADADAIIVTRTGKDIDVSDIYTVGYGQYGIRRDFGEDTVTVLSKRLVNGNLRVVFTRPLAASGQEDKEIGPNMHVIFIPSGGQAGAMHYCSPKVERMTNGEVGGSNGGMDICEGSGESHSHERFGSPGHSPEEWESEEESGPPRSGNRFRDELFVLCDEGSYLEHLQWLCWCRLQPNQIAAMDFTAMWNRKMALYKRAYHMQCLSK